MSSHRKGFSRDTSGEVLRLARVNADHPVTFTRAGTTRPGRAVDLSATGLFVETTAPPPIGCEIELLFEHGIEAGRTTLRAKVTRIGVARRQVRHRRVHHLTLTAHGFGCKFLEELPKALRDLYDDLLAIDEG